MNNELLTLTRDVEASIIPAGDKVTLAKGVQIFTQLYQIAESLLPISKEYEVFG